MAYPTRNRVQQDPAILVINVGSTSARVALFCGSEVLATSLFPMRREWNDMPRQEAARALAGEILAFLDAPALASSTVCAVAARGGKVRPVEAGVYTMDDRMIADLEEAPYGWHQSNLGGMAAYAIASKLSLPVFVVDPISTDEFHDLARVSGFPDLPRQSFFHALNGRAVVKRAARDMGVPVAQSNFIFVHLGGGISVTAFHHGVAIDASDPNEEGPFSPERAGGLPAGRLVALAFSGKYSLPELEEKLVGKGGLVAYLGTADAREIEERIKAGDAAADLVYEAMAYQVAKEIGGMAAVLKGKVDAILISGGLAHSEMFVSWIRRRVEFVAPVMVYPGEHEMQAMAEAVLEVIAGGARAKAYEPARIL